MTWEFYKLDGHKVVKAEDLTDIEWSSDHRRVADTSISPRIYISTVFLGINHNQTGEGPPIVFETMVVVNGNSVEQERYSTWEEAEKGHQRMVTKWRGESLKKQSSN